MSLKKLGRYDLLRVLGKGAMGMVYEGRDPNLDRRVAIKTIKVENLTPEEALEYEQRFRTEARSVARLTHPNIVSVYDSDRDGDVAYLVMEFIQGEDLKHHLDRGEVYSLEQTLAIMRDLLAALDYAHRQNIVHRDIKPANLLLEANGRVKLTDFGVARIQDSGDATRTQGSMVGTLKYMSPEQVQGQPIDARTDIFAAGVLLYQLLTSKRPFDGGSDFDIIQQIVSKPHAAPSDINAQLPSAVDAVVARALAKSRDQRFATAADFSAALATAVQSADDTTVVPPAGQASGRNSTWGSAITMAPSGATSLPGSTVTQEVELVYWKDIKDSEDQEDFSGFLARFPTGIYADLARRRLKKLQAMANDGSGGSGTMLVTRDKPKETPPPLPNTDDEATRALIRPTPAPAPAPAPAEPIPSGVAPLTPEAPPAETPEAPAGGSKRMLLIGAAVLAAAGLGYAFMGSKSAPPSVETPAAPASAPAVVVSAAVSAPVSAPAPAASKPASAPANSPAPVKKVQDKPAAPAAAPAKAAPQPAAAPAESVAPHASSSKAAPRASEGKAADSKESTDPTKACEGRWFISYQLCMTEQCNKPMFKGHKICEERRAMEQRNLDSMPK